MQERPIVKNAVEARQGATGHNVRYVLLAGLVLALIAFVAIEYFIR